MAVGSPSRSPEAAQRVDHRGARGERRLAGQLGEQRAARLGGDPLGGLARDPAVALDDRAGRQLQLAPPLHVGEVAEGAAHRDAGALVGLGQVVGEDGHLDPEQRRGDRGPEQPGVPLVVGVGDQGHDRREQLGAGGLDVHHRVAAGRAVEGHPVEVPGVVAGLELRLGHRGLERDVPQARRLRLVGLAAAQVAQERLLARSPASGRRWCGS